MSEPRKKDKDVPSEVRIVVEVDDTPVGSLNLDIDRLWPLISHRKRERAPVEWTDAEHYDEMLRAAIVNRLSRRLGPLLYKALGDEIVHAALDVENFTLKTEAAAQVFGRTRKEIETLAAASGRSLMDFYTFFWDYLLDDGEVADLKKAWDEAR